MKVESEPPAPLAILLTGGIGDAIAVESLLSPEQRDRLEAIYYACPASREISHLFQALTTAYPRLRHHVILPTGQTVLRDKAGVEAVAGPLPGVEDWSIGTVFPRGLPYRGSSFLTQALAGLPADLPPRPYVVVVPHSTWYAPPGRAFDLNDWIVCLHALEGHDLTGVVLCREKMSIPNHSRLLDWQGRTSILESVEVLKGASGYLGVDSWCSVLAAKLFPACRLSIKSISPHLAKWQSIYYAPRTEFGFVRPRLEAPTWS